jgi:Chlamydia polymorphic membrane protein (Chlamydia_PMP) repeat
VKKNQNCNSLNGHFCLTMPFLSKLLTLVSIAALLNFISPHAAHAAGFVGNGSAGSCTDAALNKALSGGGTVTFKCGSAAKTILIGSEKTISANTVIDGGNLVTISGGNSKRLFNVKPGIHFTVNNLTLANGHTSGQGAAIYGGSFQNTVLAVSHCNFINNVSSQLGEAGGGAIYSGAGTLTVDKSTFTGNKASIGGAIRILNSNLTVTASTFTGNKAVDTLNGNGGAIYVDGAKGDNGQIIIRDSSFKSNTATAYGGAFFNSIYNNNKTAITNSLFSANSVGGGSNGQGGAIWSNGDPATGGWWIVNANNTTLTIVNTTLAGNTASQQGGGIWISRHPKGATISRSAISGNTAVNSMGGGIVQGGNGKLAILNSTISDNKGKGPFSMGAGMYIGSTAKATISNATITNNVANWQAGGIFGGLNVTLKDTILANNVAKNGGNTWNIKHNCFGPMTNGGKNLQFPKPTDKVCTPGILIADPKLGALTNNGGLTQTRALLSGSAANRYGSGCPATDQRGVTRSRPAGTYCDIGAFEAGF